MTQGEGYAGAQGRNVGASISHYLYVREPGEMRVLEFASKNAKESRSPAPVARLALIILSTGTP